MRYRLYSSPYCSPQHQTPLLYETPTIGDKPGVIQNIITELELSSKDMSIQLNKKKKLYITLLQALCLECEPR